MEEGLVFKSSGKFLITAEYLILKGARGLALPLRHGQTLYARPNNSDQLNWTSETFGKTWFTAQLDLNNFHIGIATDKEIANSLQKVLTECRKLNPSFLRKGMDVTICADFNLAWGLGSSSTLIYNMASWAQVDPYALLENTFGGSGYDIACAGAKGPITYQLQEDNRKVEKIVFDPSFADHLFFVYLGKKMNSRTGMTYFKEKAKYTNRDIERISQITDSIVSAHHLRDFEDLLEEHEALLSSILKMETVKSSTFGDYPGTIKSMGAWGGDFVLVTGENIEPVKKYFNNKGLETFIPYHNIVLSYE